MKIAEKTKDSKRTIKRFIKAVVDKDMVEYVNGLKMGKQVLASVKVPALLCKEFRTSGYSKNGCGSRSGNCLDVKKADG